MSPMPQPAETGVADALDTLVHQFSDKLSFFRELIQNAIDAGTSEIEINFEFEPEGPEGGLATIYIDDWGEGMDRAIIDTRLTRLFSSTKDDDLTKIGRFGIGFVSVFAIEPDAVCVDTAKGGETWRVLFNKDRSFRRIQLDEPVEGTKVRILKQMPEDEYLELVANARSTIHYWCKHVGIDLRVDGELISGPVDLSEARVARFEEPGTTIVVAYGRPFFGFYNRGLTLMEGRGDTYYPHVAFKVSSRYLEHTLTRDNVIRDTHYDKAMKLVDRVIRQDLPLVVMGAIEEIIREKLGWPIGLSYEVERMLATAPLPAEALRAVVARSASDELLTLRDIEKAADGKKLLVARMRSALTQRLEEDGWTVALTTDQPGNIHRRALRSFSRGQAMPASAFVTSVPIDSKDEHVALTRAVGAAASKLGYRIRDVVVASLRYPESAVTKDMAIVQAELHGVTPVDEIGEVEGRFFSRKRFLVLNADNGYVRELLEVAQRQPALAGYLFWKRFDLDHELRKHNARKLTEVFAGAQ